MGIREFLVTKIVEDPTLMSLGYNRDSVFGSHSIDTPQVRPLIVLRWQASNPGFITVQGGSALSNWPINQKIVQVWVHDNPGDYARIDESLNRLRAILTSVEGVNVGSPNEWIHAIVWEGDSDDLSDDMLRTITRNAQFRLTGSAI
jgi:hypothetical protein